MLAADPWRFCAGSAEGWVIAELCRGALRSACVNLCRPLAQLALLTHAVWQVLQAG